MKRGYDGAWYVAYGVASLAFFAAFFLTGLHWDLFACAIGCHALSRTFDPDR